MSNSNDIEIKDDSQKWNEIYGSDVISRYTSDNVTIWAMKILLFKNIIVIFNKN